MACYGHIGKGKLKGNIYISEFPKILKKIIENPVDFKAKDNEGNNAVAICC